MFDRRALVQQHAKFQDRGYTGSPPPHVVHALNHYDRFERADQEQHVPWEQAQLYLEAHAEVSGRVQRLDAQRDAEDAIADYLEQEVLPKSSDSYLAKLVEVMRHCHAGGYYAWSQKREKCVIHWDAKCQCLQLCPHEANEDTQRMTERYLPRLMELHQEGYHFQKWTLTQRCVTQGEAVKDRTFREIRERLAWERAELLERHREATAMAWFNGVPTPKFPELPGKDPTPHLENRLHRELLRYTRRFDKLLKMRWPTSIVKKCWMLGIEYDPETATPKERKAMAEHVREYKGRVFPQIEGALMTMECPQNYEGMWHPHLNVLVVIKGNWVDWALLQRLWGGICDRKSERQMIEITETRMRAKGVNVGKLTFQDVLRVALQEIIKYPVQTVAAKSAGNVGAWSGGERGEGRFLTPSGKPIAPPLTQWTGESFLEWWYAQYGFRRTRSYGKDVLYAWDAPEEEPIDASELVPLGQIRRIAGRYFVAEPLIDLIEGHNSVPAGYSFWDLHGLGELSPYWAMAGPEAEAWLKREMMMFDYLKRRQAQKEADAGGLPWPKPH